MYPILLNAAATLAEGTTGVLDSGKLQAPFRAPMLIEELRWTAYGPPVAYSGNLGIGSISDGLLEMGGSISARIAAGRFALTNAFVPIWLFGPQIQATPNAFGGGGAFYGSGQLPESHLGQEIDLVNKAVTYTHYLWKLPQPLYLPAGTPMQVQVQRGRDGMGGNAVVNCAFAGKVLEATDPKPALSCIPYVTAFVPPEGQAQSQSSEMDLGNPFQIPLTVQRLCGRVRFRDVASPLMYDEGFVTNPDTHLTAQTAIQVKMQMEHGPLIVRDLTPFYDVFDANRRAWTFSTELRPKQRIDAVVTDVGTKEQPMISLVGYREEKI